MAIIRTVLVTFATILAIVSAFSSGPIPSDQCLSGPSETLHGATPQTSPAPYTLEVLDDSGTLLTSYTAGQTVTGKFERNVTITISANYDTM